MGGLGNGRRGGRSPPLLIGALIACILVLGFNYWVSSSRNLELQTRLYELESQLRRAATDHAALEVKRKENQEEEQRQRDQVTRIETLYKKQLEEEQRERGLMQINISTSSKTIKEQKVQLNRLNDDLEKSQKGRQGCQGDLNNLNKKLTYETTQCSTQLLAQVEQCDEKVAAAKMAALKKMEKVNIPVSPQVKASPILKGGSSQKAGVVDQEEGPGKAGLDDTKTPLVLGSAPEPSQPKTTAPEQEAPELLTNEIIGHEALAAPVSPSRPASGVKSTAAVTQYQDSPAGDIARAKGTPGAAGQTLKKNRTDDKGLEIMDTHGAVTQPEGAEDILIGQQKGEETPIGQKVDEPEDYDADEQIVGGTDLEKQNQSEKNDAARELDEELADYNGDDDNEGEFEADKQAELAQI